MNPLSLQTRFAPHSRCFGCGPANPDGLRLGSHVEGDLVIARWQPDDRHQAFPDMLNGGIIGTLLDCHGNWSAAWHLMQRNQLERPPCTVTAGFTVKLLRPTPIAQPVELVARLTDATADRATIEAELSADGKVRATFRGLFVAVRPGHPAYHQW